MYFDISMERYCKRIGCEGYTKRLQFFNANYPTRIFLTEKNWKNDLHVCVEKIVYFVITATAKIVTLAKDFILTKIDLMKLVILLQEIGFFNLLNDRFMKNTF